MGRRDFRRMVSSVLLVLFPAAMYAADSNPAMLYTNGAAWVNGAHVPRTSTAIFEGDLLQTRFDGVAKINETGSSVTVQPDSLVKFEGASVRIEHGAVAVSTSREMATTAGDVKVKPVSASWTEFNVEDVDGTVRIAALKGDLTITDGKEVMTLAQGQETTRDEKSSEDTDNQDQDHKKHDKRRAGAIAPAEGGILNNPVVVGAGGVAIVTTGIIVLLQHGNPVSPSDP